MTNCYDNIPERVLGASGGFRCPADQALIRVIGPDARDFLHRLCSQDLLAMADGSVRPAAFLDGKGRVLALCRLGVVGETVFVATQAATGAALAELLERFHFTEQLAVTPELDQPCTEWWALAGLPEFAADRCTVSAAGGVRMDFVQGGVQVVRWFGAAPAPPAGAAELDAGAHACLRIASGEPLVGTDSEPSTLALELPIVDHISLTKGCYTGQEIVARIHTYGHTNRSLCRLAITGTGAIAAGAVLSEPDDDDPVGRVMSAADIPGAPARIAFGFVPAPLAVAGTPLRLVGEPPAEVTVL